MDKVTKVIELPIYNFVITLHDPDTDNPGTSCGGTISSALQDDFVDYPANDKNPAEDYYPFLTHYISAADTIESMVLAHACAGVDVESPAYLEGLETAIEAVYHRYLN